MEIDHTQQFTTVQEAVDLLATVPKENQRDELLKIVRYNIEIDEYGFASELVYAFQLIP